MRYLDARIYEFHTTGIIRHGQQPGNNNSDVPQHGPRIVGLAGAEPRSTPSAVPLPDDGDKHAGGFGLSVMSAALVRIARRTPLYPLTPCCLGKRIKS